MVWVVDCGRVGGLNEVFLGFDRVALWFVEGLVVYYGINLGFSWGGGDYGNFPTILRFVAMGFCESLFY